MNDHLGSSRAKCGVEICLALLYFCSAEGGLFCGFGLLRITCRIGGGAVDVSDARVVVRSGRGEVRAAGSGEFGVLGVPVS